MYYLQITLEDQINAMIDSVNVINGLVNDDIHSIDVYDELDRNYRHLEYMISKQEIIEAGDLTPFTDAIASGRAFTGIEA